MPRTCGGHNLCMQEPALKKRRMIYDYPLYYDVLFGWDRDKEACFYASAFRHYGVGRAEGAIEIACGTGQVALRLAQKGWKVAGLDLSRGMTAFLSRAAGERGVAVETISADMTRFAVRRRKGAAFCPMGSIGILHDDAAVLRHFEAVWQALRPGGIYILDVHFERKRMPRRANPAERWTMQRGDIEVASRGGVIAVRDGRRSLELGWGVPLRRYSAAHFLGLVEKSRRFRVEAWHPEARKRGGGISTFDVRRIRAPGTGRGMIVLRRLPANAAPSRAAASHARRSISEKLR